MRALVTRPIPEAGLDILRAAGVDVTVSIHDRPMTAQELLAASQGVSGLLSMLTDRINAEFLTAVPSLKGVANFAVGYNNIDVPACTARRVGVSNTPGVLTEATAEVAWMLMMMAARRAGEGERMVRAIRGGVGGESRGIGGGNEVSGGGVGDKTHRVGGKSGGVGGESGGGRGSGWEGWGPLQLLGMDVVGRTLGVIGAGRIGSRVARMAGGFDMNVVYHNRKASEELEKLGARLVGLEELLRVSDFVSVHVPLSAETRHMIGGPQLALMKPTAVLVNTSRGPVVDEGALVEALRGGVIFAAGLDVYEEEPKVHAGLLELENVVLLPHIGSATVSTRGKMAEMAARNLVAMLAGRRPENAVNDVWGRH